MINKITSIVKALNGKLPNKVELGPLLNEKHSWEKADVLYHLQAQDQVLSLEPLLANSKLTTEPPIFISENHGMAWPSWQFSFRQGIILKNAILLHVDTHHDLRESFDNQKMSRNLAKILASPKHIDDFIVPALWHKIIGSYHWLLSPWTTKETINQHLEETAIFDEFPSSLNILKITASYMMDIGTLFAAVNSERNAFSGDARMINEMRYLRGHIITFYERKIKSCLHTIDEPDLKLPNRSNLILNIDLDWFGLRGRQEVDFCGRLNLLLNILRTNTIRPSLINLALSSSYTHPSILRGDSLTKLLLAFFA